MNIKTYRYSVSDIHLDFEFDSTGPKGKIRIALAANWHEIELLLHVFGYHQEEGWLPFRKNINYQAFLVNRKKGEKSEIFLKKHGFPEELLKKK